MKTIRNLIGRALCTWLGFHAYSPVAEEADLSGRAHRVRECRYCGHRVWLGPVPLRERVRAEASARGPLGKGFVGKLPEFPLEFTLTSEGEEWLRELTWLDDKGGKVPCEIEVTPMDPDAPAVGAYVTPEHYAARLVDLRARQARQRLPQKPARPVTALRGNALSDDLLDRVTLLRRDRRPDEVAAQVMEEGVGRASPLEPRRWAVNGFGPMREWQA